jgi:rRNA-processing protein FCF1
MLLVDAANVVGSRPTGWWRDRAGAAGRLVEQLRAVVDSGQIAQPVVVVLEGKAREGASSGLIGGVTVVHADGSGDDTLVQVLAESDDGPVTLVTADRELRGRAEVLGAQVVGPRWLLQILNA